jgi:hypothetical protein
MNLRFTQCHRPAKRDFAREPLGTAWLRKKTVQIKAQSTSTTIAAPFNHRYRFLRSALTSIKTPVRKWIHQVLNTFRKDSQPTTR